MIIGLFPASIGRAYERGYKKYIIPGPGKVKVRMLSFSVIKPKIVSISQLPV